MASIILNTAHRRKTKDGLRFVDAGEALTIGPDISADDAAMLVARGAAVEAPKKAEPAK